ncbi:MAG: hypothetical protein IKI04_02270 [Bacilli bacterium]|nr:hypothetical protein [Bacilli bacterium]
MEKNNNGKVVAIVALVVAVVALSVGFAAFADDLTIAGQATARAGADPFDDPTNGLEYDSTSPKCFYTGDVNETAITGADAGTASGDTWSGIDVPLTSDHHSVTCTATVVNNTSYTAYLTAIAANRGLQCTDNSGSANASTNAANICAGASLDISIGNDTLTVTNAQASITSNLTSSISSGGGTVTVTVEASYNPNALTDEDVVISLPTITHSYSSTR